MNEKDYTGIVPDQHTGVPIDATSEIEFETEKAAKAFFEVARKRLLNVNQWHEIAGAISAEFQLTDEKGNKVNGEAREGLYFKIDIPGPGSEAGRGFDWVKIEAVQEKSGENVDQAGIRVRPAPNPQHKEEKIAHFYSDESTSSFTVSREGKKVTAAIYDRNVKPNKETETFTDKVRDAVVGAVGIIGFSKIQWKSLADALVEKED